MTVYDDTLARVLLRLQSTGLPSNPRRAHRTAVIKDECPLLELIDGRDRIIGVDKGCATTRQGEFVVRVNVRGDTDTASATAWDYADQVLQVLNPRFAGYPNGVDLKAGDISPDREIADADICALDMEFTFDYPAGAWSLQAP